jgi:carbonic anhydrase/acetyltransferase-like protein (isoleucine patch superfamily)
MILSSGTKKPKIHPNAYVAPTATISGDVTVGAGCAVLHGAIITAEGAPVTIGADTVIMENAVVKASGGSATQFAVTVGDRCIIGPHAYVVGATIEGGCMIGSGAVVYNGVTLKAHTRLTDGETRLPSGDFIEAIFNVERSPDAAAKAALTYAQFLRKTHAQDAVLDSHANKAPARRSAGEEPPKQQTTEVDTVVDAMMLELQEMELKRQEAMKKKPKR